MSCWIAKTGNQAEKHTSVSHTRPFVALCGVELLADSGRVHSDGSELPRCPGCERGSDMARLDSIRKICICSKCGAKHTLKGSR